MYFGKSGDNNASFLRPFRLWNGNIFEGTEINIIDPNPTLNVGSTFAIGMWIYIIEILADHTLWCKT